MGALSLAGPAHADGTVVVHGTDFPVGTGLAHVGCAGLYDTTSAPVRPTIVQGPGTAPLGARSLGFDLAGGDAVGPVRYTGQLSAVTTASLSAHAPAGTTGVAWAGYQEPTLAGSTVVWFGRAPLTLAAGGWRDVDVAGLSYEWTSYDTRTHQVLAAGPTQTIADFTAAHGGTGAGMVAVTLGCDGNAFNVDALRFGDAAGLTTYDLEGLATQISMAGGRSVVTAGEPVRIDGTLSATGGAVLPFATAILERRTPSTDGWQTVRVADAAGGLNAAVEPPERTEYRWRFVDRPLASASTSATFVVDVARAISARVSGDGTRVLGRAMPGRAGLSVTLRPTTGDGPTVSTTTGADGSYSLSLEGLPSGAYAVSVAAADGNLRGESARLQVTGSSAPTPSPTPTPGPSSSPSGQPSSAPSTPPPAPSETPAGTPSTAPSPSVAPEPTRTPEATPTGPAPSDSSTPSAAAS